jgi:hypothetical protein
MSQEKKEKEKKIPQLRCLHCGTTRCLVCRGDLDGNDKRWLFCDCGSAHPKCLNWARTKQVGLGFLEDIPKNPLWTCQECGFQYVFHEGGPPEVVDRAIRVQARASNCCEAFFFGGFVFTFFAWMFLKIGGVFEGEDRGTKGVLTWLICSFVSAFLFNCVCYGGYRNKVRNGLAETYFPLAFRRVDDKA